MNEPFKILVIDDSIGERTRLRALLERLPACTVHDAGVGPSGRLPPVAPDVQLILLDLRMPDMQGFEIALQLRSSEHTSHIPVIFITAALTAEEWQQRGYGPGAADFLPKPLDDHQLLNRVRLYQNLHSANEQLREARERLCMTQDQLVQSEKLTALGPIVAAVAHELNTPIGNCMTIASTLEAKIDEFEKALNSNGALKRSQLLDHLSVTRGASQMMLRNLFRSADLVSNFKQVAVDHASSQRRSFDLKDIIGGVVLLMRSTLRNSPYTIELDIPGGIWMDSYPGPIDQIVSNLINNSVLHGFDGRNHGLMRLEACKQGEQVRLTYRDDGCGMSEEVRRHVFDPFFTTRVGKGGSGLGMNICHNLVTGLLGGSIEVGPLDEPGCVFIMLLPRTAPQASAA